MIRGFRHKGLGRFFQRDDRRGLRPDQVERISRILDRLDAAVRADDMNLPGWRFHPLNGDRAGRYSVTVSGNWRITFAFEGEDAIEVELEDYH
ncbi:MAG: type II toxin-antitoxin system RelE/ParE family toxin [Burkholderiales bacterium]|nr:type II toxin-antitoxin system RelE/ParE family toxin [Burkholderiales bacterium]